MDLGALWWVYVLVADDAPTYVGMTHDVPARLAKHRSGQGGRYTRRSTQWALLGAVPVGTRGQAMRVERRVKRWPEAVKRLHFAKFPWLDPAATPMPATGALFEHMAKLDDAHRVLAAAQHDVVAVYEGAVPQLVRFLRSEAWSEGNIAAYLRELAKQSPECFQYGGADVALTARAVRGVLGVGSGRRLAWGLGW
ncbi:MAG: GIY-YIG nuclease family protein [Arenimonas sp.]